MGTRLRNWSDVSDRKSSFNFSLLLWWKLFFSTLYSLLKRFVLSMCKQTVLEFQACQCSHNAWQCRIVCPSVWKTIFPSWFDQNQSSSTELPGWGFTQGEVSLYFFPACFSWGRTYLETGGVVHSLQNLACEWLRVELLQYWYRSRFYF